KGETAV
nr:Chain C, LYS-GLY-GLU-THR-ALA-VAL [Homo sapiens]4Z33_D Chain D, LYS-GLY-GLU-THR-ALA-VAL [Homo sapiens]